MYPSKAVSTSSGVASLRLSEANFGRSGRMSATHMCPSGWYMIHPRGSGPKGESISSPLASLIFHDTSFHVPTNRSLTENEADVSDLRGTGAAISCEAMSDLAASRGLV